MPPPPPIAPRHPHPLVAHGRTREDDWYWLSDRDDPETIAYLKAENEYADEVLAPTADLQETLFRDIKARVQETDAGPPTRDGGWWYFSRTVEGLQYPIMCRRPDPGRKLTAAVVVADARADRREETGEVVILDQNALAGQSDYLAVGVFDISPDHSTLAYATDLDGSERYLLRFRDLATGTDHADHVENVYYSSAWSADGGTFFYIRPDAAMRPFQAWRHTLGADAATDVLVYQEDDERFWVGLHLSRTKKRVVVGSASKTTSEVRWIDADDPTSEPRMILARRPGVEYDVEHDRDAWLIRTNQPAPDGSAAANFALYRLAEGTEDPTEMEVVIPARPDVRLDSVEAFAGQLLVAERAEADALERIRVITRGGEEHIVAQPEPVYSLMGDSNPEWDATTYRFGYTSLVTPRSFVEYDVTTRERVTVWSQPVLGEFDASRYRTERLWATAPDGAQIPISLVSSAGSEGPAPILLYGYGAYEMTQDPSFSLLRLNLLDRGVSFAIAHIRGGGERGRGWYEQGKMAHKVNTFTDFIAVATHLVESGRADPKAIVARGASAGGLLMGAVTNMRPDLWKAVVAEVPFVDVVTTMSDTTLPLTVTEWEEWGDPVHDEKAFERMLAYSPYDNVATHPYPAMYVTAGLNDPRVGYWEPAKWVARLRSVGAGRPERPIVLRTELGAGHSGPSGRYDVWRDEARVQAFVLTQVGRG